MQESYSSHFVIDIIYCFLL